MNYRIKTNVNRRPTFRFVNAIEYITVGYYDEIKKERIKEHSNEVGGSNLLVYPAITRKLRHVTTRERGLVNPYQKPQCLMMRLIEMFSNEGDWYELALYTRKLYINCLLDCSVRLLDRYDICMCPETVSQFSCIGEGRRGSVFY